MTAAEVLHDLHIHDIRLARDGEQLIYDAPAGAVTEEVLAQVREHKQELLAVLMVSASQAAPVPLDPDYPCVVRGQTDRWNDRGIWRCVACWPSVSAAHAPDEILPGDWKAAAAPVLSRDPATWTETERQEVQWFEANDPRSQWLRSSWAERLKPVPQPRQGP